MKFVSFSLLALLMASAVHADDSALWGAQGERWQPKGRLPDFSYAGYKAGRERIPRVRVIVNARDFGARPGTNRDQTAEIQRAIDAAAQRGGGAVFLPRGKYRIEGKLKLNASGVVLRGAGPNDTTLFFVNSLQDLHGYDIAFANGENGLVQAGKNVNNTFQAIASIDATAHRGDRTITLRRDAHEEGVSRGDVLRISMEPPNNDLSLWDHMHNDQNPNPDVTGPGSCDDARGRLGTWLGVVEKVDGKRVTFDEPLRIDVRMQWNPKIEIVKPVREVGVEDLRIELERKAHKTHHEEPGYNGIAFDEGAVVDSWIDNVRIHNADNGISLGTSLRVTVKGVRITADRDCSRTAGEGQFGCTTGHHGLKAGIDSLFDDVTIDTNFIHELTFAERTSGSVCTRCGGAVKWSIDQHGRGQYENLVTELRSTYDFEGGGGACRPAAGARNVLWGFHHAMRTPDWIGMQGTLVGDLASGENPRTSENGAWVEQAGNVDNLHDAQLDRRLAVEDMGRFAEGPFGRRDAFAESNRDRFARIGEHYAIASTVHAMPSNHALGARSIARTARLDDVEVAARARTTESGSNGNADFALILGDDGDGRYYYALFTKQRDKSGIFKATAHDRVRLAAVNGRGVDDDDWHRVSFARDGDRLVMKRDDHVLADVRDASIGAGRVGFGSLNDAALFDDIRVRVGDADVSVLAPDLVLEIAPEDDVRDVDFDDDYASLEDADEFPDELVEEPLGGEAALGCTSTSGAPALLALLALLTTRRRGAGACPRR